MVDGLVLTEGVKIFTSDKKFAFSIEFVLNALGRQKLGATPELGLRYDL